MELQRTGEKRDGRAGERRSGVPEEQRRAFEAVWSDPTGRLGWFRTINNIPIAKRYLTAGFSFFLAGGVLALLMRTQLARPENRFLDAETYNQVFTMHGTTMMFLFVIPFIEALANYMLPLLLGTRDMPFPRLTALSFWTYVLGGLFLFSSFLFGAAPDGGWFAYVPLTNREYSPGINMDFWDLGLSVAEVAAMGAAAEIIVAILRMRAPGMSINRLPAFAWAMLITAFIIMVGFTPLIVGTFMLEADRKGLTSFFVPEVGGDPLLWQHLFWSFGHPEVYIMFIPAVGIVTHIVQVFSRRPVVSYTLVVLALVATGFLSFGLWVHHMYTTGISPVAMGYFAAASVAISIPTAVQVFGWVATLWKGRPVWKTPLLWTVGGVVIFVLGGVTGVMVAATPFDHQAHDSYFVVAHLHYVLIGGVVFPLFAGLYYWLPKITGRMLSERLGRWSFWTAFIGFNLAFLPMHWTGLLGMPRRVYTYLDGLGWNGLNLASTVGAYVLAAGVLMSVANLFWSLRRGAPAGNNPWTGDTLEWSVASPPPDAQFARIPVVRDRHPVWDEEWEPESLSPAEVEPEDDEVARQLDQLDHWPTTWRGALVVSVASGRPYAITHVPGPTIVPFVMAVGMLLIFAGATVDALWLLGLGAATVGGSVIAWFRPMESETRAIDEVMNAHAEGRAGGMLPLAVSGPETNGYWGTWVFVGILLTAFATVVSSYFYLGGGPGPSWPPEPPGDLLRPVLATVLLAAGGAAATRAFMRGTKGGRTGWRRAGLAGATLLAAVYLALTLGWFRDSGIVPRESGWGSGFIAVQAFQWLVLLVLLAMLAAAQIWAWRRPADPRGGAVAWNASLVSYFAAASSVAVFFVLYVTPRLW
ncbi:MAG: cytochrome c oxidase subunit I [Gemmatimonadota bacterium]